MAELATPSAAAMFDGSTTTGEKKRPEKPDEAVYQANLKKAEKEHADAQKRFVSIWGKNESMGRLHWSNSDTIQY